MVVRHLLVVYFGSGVSWDECLFMSSLRKRNIFLTDKLLVICLSSLMKCFIASRRLLQSCHHRDLAEKISSSV